jgi:two-component system KDP operon response regulator KdpE
MNILVIDDDIAMTDLMRLILEPAATNVITSNSAKEGIALAQKNDPDMVILDLMMPEMSGWEVCSALRSFSNAPILVLSALDNPAVVAKALNAGADDYLIKPVTNSLLLAYINKLMRRMQVDQPIRYDLNVQ